MFNASAQPRTDVVRVPLEGFPPWRISVTRFDIHPLSMPSFAGVEVDGRPARLVASADPNRVRFLPGVGGLDVEFVAADVPAFGCRRFTLLAPPSRRPTSSTTAARSRGRRRASRRRRRHVHGHARRSHVRRAVSGSRTRSTAATPTTPTPIPPRHPLPLRSRVERTRHASGIARLRVQHTIDEIGACTITATVAPGVPFVRFAVTLDNRAPDHRLRLRFPTGAPVDTFDAATTFDTAHRAPRRPSTTRLGAPRATTFAHQGWIAANGLVVGAPGLPEAEVTPDGDILVTLVRSVGYSRVSSCAPGRFPPARRCPHPARRCKARSPRRSRSPARPRRARERGRDVGRARRQTRRASHQTPRCLTLDAPSAASCRRASPREDGDGIIVRVLNPSDTDEVDHAHVRRSGRTAGAGAARRVTDRRAGGARRTDRAADGSRRTVCGRYVCACAVSGSARPSRRRVARDAGRFASEPKKCVSPKLKTPPSAATNQ